MKAHRLEGQSFTQKELSIALIVFLTLCFAFALFSGGGVLGAIVITLCIGVPIVGIVGMPIQEHLLVEKSESYEDEIKKLKEKIIITTTQSVPSRNILAILGTVEGTSPRTASTPREADVAKQEAMLALIKNALSMGADAVVNAQMHTSNFEHEGSKWMVSKFYWTGTAVKLAE